MSAHDRPLAPKVLFVLLAVGFVAIYCNRVWRVYSAQRSAKSSAIIPGLEHAMRLAPDNAVFPHLLGLELSVSGGHYDDAVANLRKAVTLNPYRGRYWLDLASAYQEGGNLPLQNEAVQSALAAEPGNPEVAAEAAQYYLAAGEAEHAMPLVRQALDQDPQTASTLLLTCWRTTRDASLLLAKAIPPKPDIQLAFLRVLTEQEQKADADEAWRQIVASRNSFPPELAAFYFEYLLKEHDVAGFSRAWHALAGIAPTLRPYLPGGNLIVNPSFDQPILAYGFDWRYQPAEHVLAGIDDAERHSGRRSLSLSYDGNPAYDVGWEQLIPVRPKTAYEFTAWIKSDSVTSSSGPRLAIVDAYSGANLLLTGDVLDTHPWHEVSGRMEVPAGTELVAVRIIRTPANTKIRGRVWIDDLRLEAR